MNRLQGQYIPSPSLGGNIKIQCTVDMDYVTV